MRSLSDLFIAMITSVVFFIVITMMRGMDDDHIRNNDVLYRSAYRLLAKLVHPGKNKKELKKKATVSGCHCHHCCH